MTTTSVLSADTKVTLLLCGRFGDHRLSAKPLTQSEFHKLDAVLEGRRGNGRPDTFSSNGGNSSKFSYQSLPSSEYYRKPGRQNDYFRFISFWRSYGRMP